MLLKITNYFIHSAITAVHFFACISTLEYEFKFKIEYFNNTAYRLKGLLDREWMTANNITGIELVHSAESEDQMCTAASEYAALDLYNSTRDRTTNIFYYLSSYNPLVPLTKCNTVPPSYLRLGNSSNETIVIMMEPNRYEDVRFRADLVRSEYEPKSCKELLEEDRENFDTDEHEFAALVQSTCTLNRKLRTSRLSKFSNSDRLDVCVAAKIYLHGKKENVPGRLPKFQKHEVEYAQLFDVKYRTGNVKRVAIRCPTAPRMYVYFRNLRVNDDMQIMLVQEAIVAKN